MNKILYIALIILTVLGVIIGVFFNAANLFIALDGGSFEGHAFISFNIFYVGSLISLIMLNQDKLISMK